MLHRKCKEEHESNCNETTRAKRDLATAEETIEYKTHHLERAKRQVESLELDIQAAKRAKTEAQENLNRLQQETKE